MLITDAIVGFGQFVPYGAVAFTGYEDTGHS